EPLTGDRWLLLAMRDAADSAIPIGPAWLRAAMIDITALGDTPVLTLITTAVVGYLIVAKRDEMALLLVFAVAGGATVSTLTKAVIGRARPEVINHLVEITSGSFPSGHAMNSAVTFLTLGALL